MATNVFANNNEVCCKASTGKTIAAMPDVCFTPPDKVPPTPPGVPVPYPNTGVASDLDKGSKKVSIKNKPVAKKNKSYFKKSTGDEAGAAQKKGVITSKNKGKVYFQAWSMNVKVEGKNVPRHLDMTTNNHSSQPGDTPPWPFMASMAIANGKTDDPCAEEKENEQSACEKHGGDRSKECGDSDCSKAQACKLVPYGGSGSPNCCDGFTGDHLIEASSFSTRRTKGAAVAGCQNYDLNAAPTCCCEGGAYSKDHGFMSAIRGQAASQCPVAAIPLNNGGSIQGKRATTYKEARDNGARSVRSVFTHCDEKCIAAQLDTYHKKVGINDDTKIRAITYGDSVKWIQNLM